MAEYGIQIFNEKGENIVEKYSGTYVIDTFLVDNAGSRSYPLSSGESLQAVLLANGGYSRDTGITPPTVSGGTVSWGFERYGPTGTIVVTKRVSK